MIYGNPHVSWGPADFRATTSTSPASPAGRTSRWSCGSCRSGNTTLNDTWGHFRDNRVQWWLGNGSGPHLRATRNAGVIGLLFGGGASGTTSAQTDGGLFFRLARRYLAHPLALG